MHVGYTTNYGLPRNIRRKMWRHKICVEGIPQIMVYLGTHIEKTWRHNIHVEGRPQIMVYLGTYIEKNVVTQYMHGG